MRLFQHASYDFIKVQRWAWAVTGAVILAGLIAMVIHPVQSSVEFTGGTLIEVKANAAADFGPIRAALDR
ncbi:MAG TPA: hypothetical protein VFI13_12115, partial [Gemmatimonadales bacterium]|nr:hypothetical protein [Gemmatimonadales bacterium]